MGFFDGQGNCCCGEAGTEPCKLHSVSVIDECDPLDWLEQKNYNSWAEYRRKFGRKAKFYILQPYPDHRGVNQYGNTSWPWPLNIPSNYDGAMPITSIRNSDFAIDWYNGFGMSATINFGDKVSLFIDDSGSMRVAEVENSIDLFVSYLENHVAADTGEDYPITTGNGRLLFVFNGNEDWIRPHLDISCDDFELEDAVTGRTV